MNKKKLCVGSLALALSLGSIAPAFSSNIVPVSYATSTENSTPSAGNAGATTSPDATTNQGDGSQNLTDDQKRDKLTSLVNAKPIVHATDSYVNATDLEKKAYDEAIDAASKVTTDTEISVVEANIKAIEDARKNLGATAMKSYDQRDGLSSLVAIANKLSKEQSLKEADKTKLSNEIKKATDTLASVNKTTDEIGKVRNELAQAISDVIVDNGLTANNYALTSEEVDQLTSDDNAKYGRSRQNLNDIVNTANAYWTAENAKGTESSLTSDQRNALSNAITAAAGIYNNLNSTTDQLEEAYTQLNAALDTAYKAANETNTVESRLKAEITESTKNDPAEYANASQASQLTYNIAKARANEVSAKNDATAADLQKAINGLRLARLSLAPVQTKTIDQNRPTDPAVERINLQKELDNEASVKGSTAYTGASTETRSAYDKAISEGRTTRDKANATAEELRNATTAIKNAQAGLKPAANQSTVATDTDIIRLQAHVDNEATIKETSYYKTASKYKQDAYTNAIGKARDILKDHKDITKPNATKAAVDEANNAISKALNDMGYIPTTYSTALAEILALDSGFRLTDAYLNKSRPGATQAEKDLVNNYNDLINKARTELAKANPSVDLLNNYAYRINNAKRAINGQMKEAEYNVRKLLSEEKEFTESAKYTQAKASTDPVVKKALADYAELIKQAKNLVDSSNVSDSQLSRLYTDITNAVNLINNPSTENINLYKLLDLVKTANLAKSASNYETYVPQAEREALQKAIDKANAAILNGSRTAKDVTDAISDMEAALKPKKIQDLITEANKPSVVANTDINKLSLKELADLADKIKGYSTYQYINALDRYTFEGRISQARGVLAGTSNVSEENARKELIEKMSEASYQSIIERLADNEKTGLTEPEPVTYLRKLVEVAEKVKADSTAFNKLTDTQRAKFNADLEAAQNNVKLGSLASVETSIKDLVNNLNHDDVKAILKSNNLEIPTRAKATTTDISNLNLAELIDLANKVILHPDYVGVGLTQKNNLNEALTAAKKAITDADKKEAQTNLLAQLNQSEIKPIVAKIRNAATSESAKLKELRELLAFAEKVVAHPDYKAIDSKIKTDLEAAMIEARSAILSADETKIATALTNLNKQLENEAFKDIVAKVKSDTLTNKQRVEVYINGDEALRKTNNYKKAKKANRDAYDAAITAAKDLAKKENATETEFATALTNIEAAVKALDGNQFDAKLKELKEKAATIADENKRKEIEAQLKSVEANPDATMDELATIETEIANAPKLTGTTTPVTTTTQPVTTTTTTQTPVPMTTTTPVTTTSTVPATVNPGSIVRTGIKSLAGVALVLAIAVGGFVITGKNKDDKKRKGDNNNEIK